LGQRLWNEPDMSANDYRDQDRENTTTTPAHSSKRVSQKTVADERANEINAREDCPDHDLA
jgi:hypothetical protein